MGVGHRIGRVAQPFLACIGDHAKRAYCGVLQFIKVIQHVFSLPGERQTGPWHRLGLRLIFCSHAGYQHAEFGTFQILDQNRQIFGLI
jgi:hypothetical protein